MKGTKIEAATKRHRKRTQTPGSPTVVVSLPLSSPRQRSAPEMTRQRRSVSVAETSPLAQLKPTIVKLQLDRSSQPSPPIGNPPAPKSEPPAAGQPPLPADLPAVEWTSRGTIKWSGAKTDTQTLPANERAPIKRLPIKKALTHIQPIAGAPRIKSIQSRTYTQVCASVPPRLRAFAPRFHASAPLRLRVTHLRVSARRARRAGLPQGSWSGAPHCAKPNAHPKPTQVETGLLLRRRALLAAVRSARVELGRLCQAQMPSLLVTMRRQAKREGREVEGEGEGLSEVERDGEGEGGVQGEG